MSASFFTLKLDYSPKHALLQSKNKMFQNCQQSAYYVNLRISNKIAVIKGC